jgi:hypothetical protein
VSTALATKGVSSLKQRVMNFVKLASIEVTPSDEKLLPELAALLPPRTTVYVAHTPKADFSDIIRMAVKIQCSGLGASPHVVARRLTDNNTLREGLQALRMHHHPRRLQQCRSVN